MVDGMEKLPRGIRNKNPGNIKLGTDWDGLSAEQTDPTFCIFDEAVMGIRALQRICLLYTSPSPREKRQSRMPSSA